MEVALITGCASGIGRALAEELNGRKLPDGRKAYKVYATDKSREDVRDLEPSGIFTAQLDVTSEDSIKAAVDGILTKEGHIDLLVCNAGMGASGWLVEIPMSDVQRLFDVNVFGVFRTIQAVAPSMMDRRKGKIATLCSVNSWVCQSFNGLYSGAKSALAMMTEALRIEVEPFGIHVTSIVPGWVKSKMIENSVVRYDKFDAPTGHYHKLMYRVRDRKNFNHQQGITTQKAALDIANGLTKQKPPRYVYTGTWIRYSLFAGFLQTWISPTFIARKIQKNYHLDHKEKLGREGAPPYTPSKKQA